MCRWWSISCLWGAPSLGGLWPLSARILPSPLSCLNHRRCSGSAGLSGTKCYCEQQEQCWLLGVPWDFNERGSWSAHGPCTGKRKQGAMCKMVIIVSQAFLTYEVLNSHEQHCVFGSCCAYLSMYPGTILISMSCLCSIANVFCQLVLIPWRIMDTCCSLEQLVIVKPFLPHSIHLPQMPRLKKKTKLKYRHLSVGFAEIK